MSSSATLVRARVESTWKGWMRLATGSHATAFFLNVLILILILIFDLVCLIWFAFV